VYSIHPENAKGERRSEGGGQLRQSRNLSRLSWANPIAKSKTILLPPGPFQLDSIRACKRFFFPPLEEHVYRPNKQYGMGFDPPLFSLAFVMVKESFVL
jgi:hypothetical protein